MRRERDVALVIAACAAGCALLLTRPATAAELAVDVAVEHLAATFPRGHESELSAVTLGIDLAAGPRTLVRFEVPAVRGRATESLLTRLGPTPRVLSALRGRGRDQLLAPIPGEWESGLGDVRLGVERELGGGGARLFRVAAAAEVKAPTADADRRLGSGEWDARVGLFGERRTWSTTVFWGLGWNRLGDPRGVELADAPDGYLGVESEPWRGRVRGAAWIEAHGEVAPDAGPRAALGLGLRGAGRRPWRLAGTIGLTDGAEDFRVVAGTAVGAVDGDRVRSPRRPGGR